MAVCLVVFIPPTNKNPLKSTKILLRSVPVPRLVRFVTSAKNENPNVISRRSAYYKPCIWDNKYIQSLQNFYAGETYRRRAEKLKEDVKIIMKNNVKPLEQLELIHVLQRLGLAYHFEEEISRTLENIYNCKKSNWDGKDLHETALGFRLLRQHGYDVPQDIFKRFLNNNGSFDECIRDDVRGMLSLYEASYYSMDNESILEEAWVFTYNQLTELIKSPIKIKEENVYMVLVSHALDLPLHWRLTRWEARWYIDIYERESGMNTVILELAKLDFNIMQAIYQQEIKDLSRWWKKLGLVENLSFARSRLVEAYLWAIGINFVPQGGYCRKIITAGTAIISVVDDIYDVYGTLDELVLFTKAVERWDIKSIDELPDYMKIPFLALFNTVNEMAYDILREHNIDVFPHLKKAYLDLMIAFLQEAKWYHTGYRPTFEEYMNIGQISIGGNLLDLATYISANGAITTEALEFLESDPEIVRSTNMIFRLSDDLGTSTDEMKRGDVPKAIQCHMYDTCVSEEVSREQMKELIRQTWKKTNRYRVVESPLPKSTVEMILNFARTSQTTYQYGDGFGNIQDTTETMNAALALLTEPIPL